MTSADGVGKNGPPANKLLQRLSPRDFALISPYLDQFDASADRAAGGIINHGFLPAFSRIAVRFPGPFTPVAELIRARELPIIFATGYGAEGLPEQFRDLSALQKPFQMEALAAMIDEVMGRRAS
jgi:hypothetical protein